jgi:hypothetical protein
MRNAEHRLGDIEEQPLPLALVEQIEQRGYLP